MRRFQSAVIALQTAAIVGLLWLHFGKREEPAPAKTEVPSPETAAEPVQAPRPKPADAPETQKRGESDAEQRAREYQEARSSETADLETTQFESLLESARNLFAQGGLDALLWAPFPHDQKGQGNDEDLRRLVALFASETDPARLWALAQRIRFHLTDPRGSIWTIDQNAFDAFSTCAREAEDPVKRQIALSACGATGWGDDLKTDRFLHDPDARVQATAGPMLGRPRGVSESEAAPIADRFRELLRSPDEHVRASAAMGFTGWAYREDDVEALITAAKTDTSMNVRRSALYGLGMSGSERARRTLKEIVADTSYPEDLRSRAATELSRTGIVPDGAPLHEVE
ncbi:MAG: HEAT repeat domain-containing protein [Planctomycetes bacterium]|nr:HEAT repeat domain-containing protein [Planctomycetota bacterium]